MRIVSWNIHRCFGVDGKYRPERVLEALLRFNPDIVFIQEIDSSLFAPRGMNQLEFLERGLAMPSLMGPTLRRSYGSYGNAIFTRFEIQSCEVFDLSFRKLEPRGALIATLKLSPELSIRLINTHLGLTYWERSFQTDRLLSDLVWTDQKNVILGGDFNDWFPWAPNTRRLERAFDFKTKRFPSFPSYWPRFALDRIFFSGSVTSLNMDTELAAQEFMASDHLAVIADVEFSF